MWAARRGYDHILEKIDLPPAPPYAGRITAVVMRGPFRRAGC